MFFLLSHDMVAYFYSFNRFYQWHLSELPAAFMTAFFSFT